MWKDERLMAKLSLSATGCYEWTGCLDRKGYGRIKKNGKTQFAHRIAWERVNGTIPEGMLVLHSCDNPPCCNVNHLRLGTHQDNTNDMMDRGRGKHAIMADGQRRIVETR